MARVAARLKLPSRRECNDPPRCLKNIHYISVLLAKVESARNRAGWVICGAYQQGVDNGSIFLDFKDSLPPNSLIEGMTHGNVGNIYTRTTGTGYAWESLGVSVDGAERTVQIGLHEGLHALGVGGSRRAEALVRLEELRSMGVPIDRAAMRQVLEDMSSNYDNFRWLSGKKTDHFPELKY